MDIEQRLGRLALDHLIGDRVSVMLVGIAVASDAAGQLHTTTLLHDMGGLVSREVQVWRFLKRDVIARRVRLRAHALSCLGRLAADVGVHQGDVVLPECALDQVEVGQRATDSGYALLRRLPRGRCAAPLTGATDSAAVNVCLPTARDAPCSVFEPDVAPRVL